MARYFFNIHNDDITEDPEGADLIDAQAARAHAIVAARSLAAQTVAHGHFNRSHRIEIVDENRESVDTVTFGDAVDIRD